MIGDLHCHTRFSDGSMSIDDLVFYAKRAGLDFVAVTDHDTMEGVTRAMVLGKRLGINVIPALEISCMDFARGNKAHILCYLPDSPDRLQGMLGKTLAARERAGRHMIRDVMRYYPVTEEHIQRYTLGSKSIYKAHIIQAVLDLGYDCQSHGELYQQLFATEGGLCSRELEYPDVYDALELVHSAGGIAVMAHPSVYDGMELMVELAQKGRIDGIETEHPRIPPEHQAVIHQTAATYGLIQTGGSDFHGFLSGRPNPLATCVTPDGWINALFDRKRNVKKK